MLRKLIAAIQSDTASLLIGTFAVTTGLQLLQKLLEQRADAIRHADEVIAARRSLLEQLHGQIDAARAERAAQRAAHVPYPTREDLNPLGNED